MWDQPAALVPIGYVAAVQRAGGLALLLAPDEQLGREPGEALELIDGLMLAGGADIDPASYGEPAHPQTHDTVPERDAFEIALTRGGDRGGHAGARHLPRHAADQRRPAAARCVQHLPDLVGHGEHRRVLGSFDGAEHDVMLIEGSLAASAARRARARDQVPPPPGRRPARRGPRGERHLDLDELPEAIELPDRRFVLGVQWHPEADPGSPVVGALVQAAIDAGADARARVASARAGRPYTPGRSAAVERDPSSRLGGRGGRLRGPAAAPPRARRRRWSTQTVAFAAPVGLCVAVRRSRTRDVAVCCLQMWAYVAAYKTPHDDAAAQAQRVHVRYPIVADRVLGLGELPSVRLQRALARSGPDGPRWTALDRVLVWAHWSWFAVPHGALAVHHGPPPSALRARRDAHLRGVRRRRGLLLGASHGPAVVRGRARERPGQEAVEVRRMMVEYGEFFWRDGWGSLYSVFGGNPLAAMPSLHFATSVMAASLLAETGSGAAMLGYGVSRSRSASRWSTWASTTSSTCSAGRR